MNFSELFSSIMQHNHAPSKKQEQINSIDKKETSAKQMQEKMQVAQLRHSSKDYNIENEISKVKKHIQKYRQNKTLLHSCMSAFSKKKDISQIAVEHNAKKYYDYLVQIHSVIYKGKISQEDQNILLLLAIEHSKNKGEIKEDNPVKKVAT